MKIRKLFKVLFVTAVLALCIAAPSFAATTKEEYRTEATAIRSEKLGLEAQIAELQSENFAVSAKLAEARKAKLDSKDSAIDAETWTKINELRKQITEIKRDKGAQSENDKDEAIKNAVKSKDYTAALEHLNRRLDNTKARLEAVRKKNELWKQIDALLK